MTEYLALRAGVSFYQSNPRYVVKIYTRDRITFLGYAEHEGRRYACFPHSDDPGLLVCRAEYIPHMRGNPDWARALLGVSFTPPKLVQRMGAVQMPACLGICRGVLWFRRPRSGEQETAKLFVGPRLLSASALSQPYPGLELEPTRIEVLPGVILREIKPQERPLTAGRRPENGRSYGEEEGYFVNRKPLPVVRPTPAPPPAPEEIPLLEDRLSKRRRRRPDESKLPTKERIAKRIKERKEKYSLTD